MGDYYTAWGMSSGGNSSAVRLPSAISSVRPPSRPRRLGGPETSERKKMNSKSLSHLLFMNLSAVFKRKPDASQAMGGPETSDRGRAVAQKMVVRREGCNWEQVVCD